MIRISIRWNFTSPFLKVLRGTLIIEDVDMRHGYIVTPLITCEVKKEEGTLGFKCIESKYYHIFEALKPTIDPMIESYYRGMLMQPTDFSWIDDSADISLSEWLEKRGLDKEDERIKHAEDTRVNF